ncbi:hypothetical protein BaRGS_00008284 [Batillaria attramentaria]|uniref:Uncharacterized protein n=1 Tax=Batillaria attramentaria TaxID=370345 RepID=A0ABD0LLZ6_9CAEN
MVTGQNEEEPGRRRKGGGGEPGAYRWSNSSDGWLPTVAGEAAGYVVLNLTVCSSVSPAHSCTYLAKARGITDSRSRSSQDYDAVEKNPPIQPTNTRESRREQTTEAPTARTLTS